jgi:hypothetical protein
MRENTNTNLIGQPILTQALDLVSKITFRGLVKEHKSDRYYKKFNTWAHFVSLMFGIFSRCDSVTEIVEGMIGCVGKIVEGKIPGFTQQYRCRFLIYYELFQFIDQAIAREKELKAWRREKKEMLINRFNPDWIF